MQFNFRVFVFTLLICSLTIPLIILKPAVPQNGSFHISQEIDDSWTQLYAASFGVTYQTKTFQLTQEDGQINIRIEQKHTSYGDIELAQLSACEHILTPTYALYVDSGESVLEDIVADDHNVAINHDKPIEILWDIPENCSEPATLTLKANEYESPEENAFRFPLEDIPAQTYTFQNNGSLTIDGTISEVDGIEDPYYSPFWKAGTGHPSNNTHIYMRDDEQFVYVAADILLDNTNEFGQDWIKIIAHNPVTGTEKEYRVDDFDHTYGTCAFGLTSKVSYQHQTCEVRIPKNELAGSKLDFVMRYYGTGGAGSIVIDQVVIANGSDTTPTLTARARALDGAAALTGATFGIYDNTLASTITANYAGTCTADDGAFDELTELISCTSTETLSYHHFRFYVRATNGGEVDTITSDFYVHNSAFSSQENTDGFGDVNNYGTYSMAVFNNKLYAGTYNTTTGAEVWQYDGTTWTQSNSDGFGNVNNFAVESLTVFNSKLYATVNNSTTGAEVWEFNGSSWTQSNTDGFTGTADITAAYSSASYNSKLYVGTDGSNGGEVWEYNGSSWSQSNTDGFGSASNSDVISLFAFDGNLYAGVYNENTGAEIWTFNGTSWTLGEDEGILSSSHIAITSMAEFSSELYAGTNAGSSRAALITGSNTTWTQVGTNGLTNSQGTSSQVESLATYNGRLYISIKNDQSPDTGAEIWSTSDGDSWILHSKGFGDSSIYRADSLAQFQGKLFAGAFNDSTGTEIWSTNTDSSAPSLSLTPVTDPTSDTTPALTGTATDSVGALVTDVEFQMDGTGGSWTNCTADDGTFDEAEEAFTCTVASALSAGSHTMYVRATDSNSNTTGGGDEETDVFVVSATPTATPAPTSAPSSDSDDESSDSEEPQIPQGQSEEIGGNFTPIKDSYTGGQSATTIVESGTFTNDAFFSAQLTVPTYSNGILTNPLAGNMPTGTGLIPSNTINAAGILAIKQACGLMWQVGGIQQMWYKTYPPKGSDKSPAIIIPELQKKPSIIALGYTEQDLIPFGQPNQKFSENSLKLAHSLDGSMWKLLPTSVVDTTNNTVAALHKIGGFYMIVSSCQTKAPREVGKALGESSVLFEDQKLAEPSLDDVSPAEEAPKPSVSNVTIRDEAPGLIQRVIGFVKSIFGNE